MFEKKKKGLSRVSFQKVRLETQVIWHKLTFKYQRKRKKIGTTLHI
uniref:Uncharacterized protein n=1 Tax=Anguilla anguilla TaxID=7936 RepID=A0A0E9XBK6_ANGAN